MESIQQKGSEQSNGHKENAYQIREEKVDDQNGKQCQSIEANFKD